MKNIEQGNRILAAATAEHKASYEAGYAAGRRDEALSSAIAHACREARFEGEKIDELLDRMPAPEITGDEEYFKETT